MASMDSTNKSKNIKQQTKGERTIHGSKMKPPFAIDANWIRSNIEMRRCTYFIPSEVGSKICHCGYEMEYHTNVYINESNPDKQANLKWELSKHTETEETNAFGEIEFDGREGNIKPKFVRVDNNIDMSVIMELIKHWGLRCPNLLISVAGDTNAFQEKSNLRDGLMKAARKTGAWIMTDGIQASGMKHVTEPELTLKENVIIGIAPWGVIHNRTALESKEGLWPAKYSTTGTCNSNERFLNPNHSHYILVDDGTQHKLDIEIPFRLRLEREMVQMKTDTGNDVLIVTVVMGGGKATLEKVDEALKQDTPVVVVKGSGGAADVLAYAFQNASTGDEDANSNDGQDRQRNEKFMPKSLEDRVGEKMKQKGISCKVKVIKRCLLKSGQIHILVLDNDDYDINDVLLNAMMKAYIDKLKNASATNMMIPPDEIMFNALKYGRADIVKQLIEKGLELRTFLTDEILLKLYNNVFFKRIFNDIGLKKKEKIRLIDVKNLVQNLVESDLLIYYMDDNHEKEGQQKTDDARTNASQERHISEQTHQELNDEQDSQKSDRMKWRDPCLDLLIWSILTNQQDNAKLFWSHGKNKLSAALVAHSLFSALSHKTDDQDLREAIDNNSSEFMTLANKITHVCYKADEKKTCHLLTRILPELGHTTCIEIALNAHNEGFISLKVYRDLFDKIWMGGLKPHSSIMMLLLCIVFPPFIIWFARFEDDYERNSSSDRNKSHVLETLCCLSSKRRKVCSELKAEANDKLDKTAKSSQSEQDKNARKARKCWKLRTFYNAPIIIFMLNMIFFAAFLFLYSYVLVSKLEPHVSAAEILLFLWAASFSSVDTLQHSKQNVLRRIHWKLYITPGWTNFSLLTFALFTIGLLILISNYQPLSVEIARVILAIAFIFYFLRILHAFYVHRQVGPKLVMMMNMVSDLGTLAVVLGVFILAYAVASYAILYPNTALTIDTPMKILKRPFWNIYGELILEEIEGDANCSYNETLYGDGAVPRCPTKTGQYVVPVMMGIYMMMTNILLVSLLIASFSYSIKKVHQHKDLHRSTHRYKLIYEYYTMPCLPHPFALLITLPKLCKHPFKTNERGQTLDLSAFTGRRNAFMQTFDKDYDDELNFFEDLHAITVYQRMEQTRKKHTDIIARHKRLETRGKSNIEKLMQDLTKTVANLEQQILKDKADMSNQMKAIMDSLKELKLGTK